MLGSTPQASRPRRRTVYGKTQAEVVRKRKDEMAEARGGIASDAGRATVGGYLGWWMENVVRDDVAHRTFHNYLSQIRNHILPALGRRSSGHSSWRTWSVSTGPWRPRGSRRRPSATSTPCYKEP